MLERLNQTFHRASRTLPAVLALVGALLLLVTPAVAQDAPRGQATDRMEVNEVAIDAVVTDSRGDVVTGLDAEDFVVEEDGEPVELTDVQFMGTAETSAASNDARRTGADQRLFVLFFHDQRTLYPRLTAQQLDAGRRAQQWVQTDLGAGDLVAVVSYDTSLAIHQDFTSDRAAAAEAIDAAVRGADEAPTAGPSGAPSLLARLPATEDGLDAVSNRIYDALQAVAAASEPIRGRKNLVLFSSGFGETDDLGLYQPDRRFYPDTVRALNHANVAVYAIDLIPTSAPGAVLGSVLSSSLSALSSDTGGEYHHNFINFMAPLEEIADATRGYYLLTYRSSGEDGYQTVDVDTADGDYRVRARRGYYAGSGLGDGR